MSVISNPKAADGFRSTHSDASVSGIVLAAATTTTPIAAKGTAWTIFVQRLVIVITTSAAQIITIKDSAGTPVVIGSIAASAALGSTYAIDFGARGFALTEGKDLVIAQTAGPAYSYAIDAYQKPTSAIAATTVDRTI